VDDPARRAFRDALIAWAVVAGLVAALVNINVELPAIGHVGSALVAVVFLYAPVVAAWRRSEDLDDYGFHAKPVKRGLVIAAIAGAIVFPLFVIGYFAFYEVACHSSLLAHLVPRNLCGSYVGLSRMHAPDLDPKLLEWCAVQLVVVALPEELFFRGFLLEMLERRFPPKRRVLGGGIGLALVISSVMFALIHLPKEGYDPRQLATFFPALLFGWMRSSTKSILASTVTHAGSNILVKVLDLISH
jgi:uncharacterized protein